MKPRDKRYALYTHLARTGLGLRVGLALWLGLALSISLHSRASAHGQSCNVSAGSCPCICLHWIMHCIGSCIVVPATQGMHMSPEM